MNINLILLKYLLTKEHYDSVRKYIKPERELFFLYQCLDELFDNHDVESFTLDEFTAFCTVKKGPDELTEALLAQLAATDISELVLADIVKETQERALAQEVALLAIDVAEGKKNFKELLTKIESHDTIVVEEKIDFVSTNLEELYEHTVAKQGLRWRLQTLNEMLGSLRRGDFGFVFARPESGKTTFLASEVSYFAEQSERTILWFNNEEQGDKVQLRIFQAALGYPLDKLLSNRAKHQEEYVKLTGDRIRIVDKANIYKRDVEHIVSQVKPSLIIFDQIDKIKGFADDREDLRLGSIYSWAREIAKEHCPVIGVCQADGSGEGKKRLTMENVANAKTSKQAEADWILGIGKQSDEGMQYIRTLHLSKNKLTGDKDSVAQLRHGTRDVIIEPEIARYKDLNK